MSGSDYNTHDILELAPDMIEDLKLSGWAADALLNCPFAVVVRCQESYLGGVTAGIRGSTRDKRQAVFVPNSAVKRSIKPETLAIQKRWKNSNELSAKMKSVLHEIDEILTEQEILWGPVGSVGFELATGFLSTHPSSDLDFILLCNKTLSKQDALFLYRSVEALPVKTDCIIETPYGGVALAEYAVKQTVMRRSSKGPGLVNDPWSAEWLMPPD